MKKTLKIKSIVINNKEIIVEQLFDKEQGIKFYVTEPIHDNFEILLGLRKTISLEKIKIRTLRNKIYTLFNCFYTIRGDSDNNLYIHLIFNEIVREDVDIRNFECNKLVVEFELTDNIRNKDFIEDIKFTLDDITIKHLINQDKYEVIILSRKPTDTEELFSYFADYFELINLIIGYFPTIIKKTYMLKDKKYVVENKEVGKYISADEFKKKDLGFLKRIDNNTFKEAYIK